MCVEFNIKKTFSSDREILQTKECARKNNLGIGISLEQELIEIDSYKGTCFCTPKNGFREALKSFLEEVLGKDYYFKYGDYSDFLGNIHVVSEKKSWCFQEDKLNFEELAEKMKWDLEEK